MPSQFLPEKPARTVQELTGRITSLVSTKFYLLDQGYRYEDRKYTGRLDKEMLYRILKSCQEELTWPEMNDLWSSFARAPDGLYTWNKFCQKFMDNDQKGKPIFNHSTSVQATEEPNKPEYLEQVTAVPKQRKSAKLSNATMDRLAADVQRNLEQLMLELHNADPTSSGLIAATDVSKLLSNSHVQISSNELDQLMHKFGTAKNGSFGYKEFLTVCTHHTANRDYAATKNGRSTAQSAAIRQALIGRLRGKEKLFKRACKAADRQGHGHLAIAGLCSALDEIKVKLTEEELFALFSEYDKELTGHIFYKPLIVSLFKDYQPIHQ